MNHVCFCLTLIEAVCFVELWNERRKRDGESQMAFVDLSQSLNRMVHSTYDSKAISLIH